MARGSGLLFSRGMESCIFCRVAEGATPARVLFADEEVVAFHDIGAACPVHVLVIPRRHIASLASTTEGDDRNPGKARPGCRRGGQAHRDRRDRLPRGDQQRPRGGSERLSPPPSRAGRPPDGVASGLMQALPPPSPDTRRGRAGRALGRGPHPHRHRPAPVASCARPGDRAGGAHPWRAGACPRTAAPATPARRRAGRGLASGGRRGRPSSRTGPVALVRPCSPARVRRLTAARRQPVCGGRGRCCRSPRSGAARAANLPRLLRRELAVRLAVRGADEAAALHMLAERVTDEASLRAAQWLAGRAGLPP